MLAVLLHAVLENVYGEDVPARDLRRSFDEMLSWENFFYADKRTVYRSAQKLERLAGRGALLTGHMKVERPAWDALNEQHTPWHNLWTPEETRTDSVPELFGLARIGAAALAGQYAAQFDAGVAAVLPFQAAVRQRQSEKNTAIERTACKGGSFLWVRALRLGATQNPLAAAIFSVMVCDMQRTVVQ